MRSIGALQTGGGAHAARLVKDDGSDRPRAVQSAIVLSVLVATAVLAFLLSWHLYLNGTRFHSFNWHHGPVWLVLGLIAAAAAPVVVVELLPEVFRSPPVVLPLLMISSLGLQWASSTLQWNELSAKPIVRHVQSPLATSFFNDAQDLVADQTSIAEFLRTYPSRMAQLHYHARNKAPGTILFYWTMLRTFGDRDRAALAGAILISILAACAIPAVWLMVRALTDDSAAARCGAAMFVLMPGLSIFLPEFDQVYVPLAALVVGLWAIAVRRGSTAAAVGAALCVCVSCFFAFNILVLGALLSAITILWFRRDVWVQIVAAIGVGALLYGAIDLLSGYNVIATLLTAWRNQNSNLIGLHWPWPRTIPTDLVEFLIDFGWMPMIPILAWLAWGRTHRAVGILCVAQPVLVACLGLMQSESARLWLFMTPLLMVPLGLEVSRWPREHRIALMGCQILLLVLVTTNLRFH